MATLMFGSDNAAGASPEMLAALAAADESYAVAYGDDRWSKQVDAAYSDFFETETFVFPVGTGTAANALSLSAVTPPYGEIVCHAQSHIYTTEGGSPEFYSGGARLVTLPGADGKIAAETLEDHLRRHGAPNRHRMIPSAVSVTQATEAGTLYALDELTRLSGIARDAGLRLHMDGARFCNALVALGASPAAMTWRAGVDVLSLGTTKNGTLNAEAVVVFDPALARDIAIRHKRAGLLVSKMRYVSAQLLAFLRDGLWRENARRANEAASTLAEVLLRRGSARLRHPVETNQLFVEFDEAALQALAAAGIGFRCWPYGDGAVYRLVTSFRTTNAEIDAVDRALSVLDPLRHPDATVAETLHPCGGG